MKYKVGDKLRIRKDLIGGATYCMENRNNRNTVVSDMLQHRDKIATITYCYTTCYEIDLDKGEYAWTDEMFEDSTEVNKQEEIPYINATEAREMFDVNYTADKLRKIVYGAIRDSVKTKKSTSVFIREYPLEVRDLICKELKFKGFDIFINLSEMVITW